MSPAPRGVDATAAGHHPGSGGMFDSRRGKVALWLLLACAAIVPLLPLLASGLDWPDTHEGPRYPVLLQQFIEAGSQPGVYYPRWLPELYGGYGYPTFVFYPPGFFFIATWLHFVAADIPGALLMAIGLLLLTGTLASYQVGRLLANPVIGLGCAIAFTLTPYLYTDLYVRGALAEFSALALQPVALLGLLLLRRAYGQGRAVTGPMLLLAASWAFVLYAHPLTAAFLAAVLGALGLGLLVRMPGSTRIPFVLGAIGAALLGAALAAPYWLGVLQMQPYVQLLAAGEGIFNPLNHLVEPAQLVSRQWGFGASVPGTGDGMSFQVGLPHLVLALGGLWWDRRNPLMWAAGLLYALLLLAMTPVATGLWEAAWLAPIQFPWRLLAPLALLQVILLTGWRHMPVPRVPGGLLLGGGLAASVAWYAPMFDTPGTGLQWPAQGIAAWTERIKPHFENFALQDEFTPQSVRQRPATPRHAGTPLLVLWGKGLATPLPGNNAHRPAFRLDVEAESVVVLQQVYLPGWQVELDGKRVADDIVRAGVAPDGRMRFRLEPGSYLFKARYAGPAGTVERYRWTALLAIIGLSLAAFSAWHAARRKRAHVPGPAPGRDRA